MNKRLILVTNDDGVASRGMEAAIEVARTYGRTVVVAPETMQSGMSQAITMYNPLFLRQVRKEEGLEMYSFSGTPVDCVKMAFEGSFYGCPSVGLSLDDHSAEADFEASIEWGKRIIGDVLARNERLPLCLNVNVPVGRPEEIRGMRLCRQNRGFWREEFFRHEDPRGREYFWLTGAFVNSEPEAEDTDEWALSHGYVSVVPVQVDMTDYEQLKHMKNVLHE